MGLDFQAVRAFFLAVFRPNSPIIHAASLGAAMLTTASGALRVLNTFECTVPNYFVCKDQLRGLRSVDGKIVVLRFPLHCRAGTSAPSRLLPRHLQ